MDFEKTFQKYGPTYMGVGWGSEESQNKRFSKICEYIPIKDDTNIVDIGCGYGALLQYMHNNLWNPYYYGMDRNKEALAYIRSKRSMTYTIDIRSTSMLKTLLDKIHTIDYIVCCGLFQHMPKLIGEDLIKVFIEYAPRSIISTRSDRSNRDKEKFVEWSLSDIEKVTRNVTNKFIIDHSYMRHDVTIVMDKET